VTQITHGKREGNSIQAPSAFVTQIWVASTSGNAANVQMTRGSKSAGNPVWSPDSKWLAFTSDRIGDRSQIFAIRPDGGEAVQLTKSETPVSSFEWSEDGKTIAYTATEPQTKPFSCIRSRTKIGSICPKSSIEISTVSKPHFLNFGKSRVDASVNGHAKRNVLIPKRMEM
jgi:dipeptidyl aminopeptidase/acylaminoacyl peptidase